MSEASGSDAVPLGTLRLGSDPSVLWYAVLGCIAPVLTIACVVGVALTGSGDLGRPRHFLALSAAGIGIAAVGGACQAAFWWYRLGSTVYEMDATGITVRTRSTSMHWAWDDLDMVRVEGSVGWRNLLVPPSVRDFPALCVRSAGQATRGPGMLVWGRSKADLLNTEARRRLTHSRADR